MTPATTARTGTTLLRCPEVIPNATWLRGHLLWADCLATFWPREEPTPRTRQDAKTLDQLPLLEDACLFERMHLHADTEELGLSLRDIPQAVISGKATTWSRQHQTLLDGLPDDSIDDVPGGAEAVDATPDYERDTFLYTSKMPTIVTDRLERDGLITPIENEYGITGYRAADPRLIPWMITGAADRLHHLTGGQVLPVPSDARHVRALVEPKPRAKAGIGLHITVPRVPSVRSDATIEQILEVRMKPGAEQARQDYMHELEILWAKLQQDYQAQGVEALRRYGNELDGQLQKAHYSFRDILGQNIFASGATAVGAVSTIVSVQADHTNPSALLDMTALVLGAVAVQPVLVRRKAPAFLRSARKVLAAA